MPPTRDLRTIQDTWVQVTTFEDTEIAPEPMTWLAGWARPGMFLLLHADDGLFWGRGAAQTLEFSDAALHTHYTQHPILIQTARLFDQTEEIFLWRVDEGKWRARRVVDGTDGERTPSFDKPQVLWGTRVEPLNGGFSRMVDGVEGLVHIVPLAVSTDDWKKDRRQLRLDVRHYLIEEQGWLRVHFSRLFNLRKETNA
jgi:CRISPR-associated protein (TIGR03984 family)